MIFFLCQTFTEEELKRARKEAQERAKRVAEALKMGKRAPLRMVGLKHAKHSKNNKELKTTEFVHDSDTSSDEEERFKVIAPDPKPKTVYKSSHKSERMDRHKSKHKSKHKDRHKDKHKLREERRQSEKEKAREKRAKFLKRREKANSYASASKEKEKQETPEVS